MARGLSLLPRPRRIRRLDGQAPPGVRRTFERALVLPAEGYEIDVRPEGVAVRYADERGRRYAEATLRQLEEQAPEGMPCVEIRDHPDFRWRGYMLDVSRDRVPTRATLARLVDLLDLLRVNHLELYTEHTFAYPGHEEVWCDASPITPADVAWLDSLCCERGIELAANQNGFGHMGRWLRHGRYRPLAEAPDGWEAPWGRRAPPGVLHPDEKSLAFVLRLYRELCRHFRSRRVNIGCDETFELGEGRSRAEVEHRGRGAVYLDFVRRIMAALHAEGREVLFWADVVRQHPETARELPRRDTVALVWWYEAPLAEPPPLGASRRLLASLGITPELMRGFGAQVPTFAGDAPPFWVCPGTSTWNSLVGRLANARANALDAAEVGLAHGAEGLLVTDWGDGGHLQPPAVSFAPLAYAASVAWCRSSNGELDLARCLDRFVFRDAAGAMGRAVELAGDAFLRPGPLCWNGSWLFYELLGRRPLLAWGEAPERSGLERALGELEDALEMLERSRPGCLDGDIVRRELLQAVRLARHGAWRWARRHELPSPDVGALRRELRDLVAEQRACWLLRSRPGGLAESLAPLERVCAS